ncbi:MAG: pilus assembly protein [Acidobacteria bacterium]|nr:pilus assembly protein [Acidobacteriota bacterium]
MPVGSKERKTRPAIFREEGSQLLEFGMALPFLLVMLVGAIDFGGAWTLKEKISSAAREGTRIAASQPNDLSSGSPPASVTAVRNAVANYLTSANVTPCAVGTTAASAGSLAWQYTSTTTGCSTFLLKIERGYTFLSGTTTVVATRVTLNYPFNWGFGQAIKFMSPTSTYANSITVSTVVVIANMN